MEDPVGASHVDGIVCAVPSMSSAATVVARTSCIIYIQSTEHGQTTRIPNRMGTVLLRTRSRIPHASLECTGA